MTSLLRTREPLLVDLPLQTLLQPRLPPLAPRKTEPENSDTSEDEDVEDDSFGPFEPDSPLADALPSVLTGFDGLLDQHDGSTLDRPTWLEQLSSRVLSMDCVMGLSGRPTGSPTNPDDRDEAHYGETRAVLGCENGSLWIFAGYAYSQQQQQPRRTSSATASPSQKRRQRPVSGAGWSALLAESAEEDHLSSPSSKKSPPLGHARKVPISARHNRKASATVSVSGHEVSTVHGHDSADKRRASQLPAIAASSDVSPVTLACTRSREETDSSAIERTTSNASLLSARPEGPCSPHSEHDDEQEWIQEVVQGEATQQTLLERPSGAHRRYSASRSAILSDAIASFEVPLPLSLEPVIEISLASDRRRSPAIVQVEIIEGAASHTASGYETEAMRDRSIVCMTRAGDVYLLSLLDGRCISRFELETADAESPSRHWTGFQIINIVGNPVLVAHHAESRSKLPLINLRSSKSDTALEIQQDLVCAPLILTVSGSYRLICATQNHQLLMYWLYADEHSVLRLANPPPVDLTIASVVPAITMLKASQDELIIAHKDGFQVCRWDDGQLVPARAFRAQLIRQLDASQDGNIAAQVAGYSKLLRRADETYAYIPASEAILSSAQTVCQGLMPGILALLVWQKTRASAKLRLVSWNSDGTSSTASETELWSRTSQQIRRLRCTYAVLVSRERLCSTYSNGDVHLSPIARPDAGITFPRALRSGASALLLVKRQGISEVVIAGSMLGQVVAWTCEPPTCIFDQRIGALPCIGLVATDEGVTARFADGVESDLRWQGSDGMPSLQMGDRRRASSSLTYQRPALMLHPFLGTASVNLRGFADEQGQSQAWSTRLLRQILQTYLRSVSDRVARALIKLMPGMVMPATSMCCRTRAVSMRTLERTGKRIWCLSAEMTAYLQLCFCTLCYLVIDRSDVAELSQVLSEHAMTLHPSVGADYKPPSLSVLAEYWLDQDDAINKAARLLMDVHIAALPRAARIDLTTSLHIPYISSEQFDEAVRHSDLPRSVLVLGLVAVADASVVSNGSLRNLAHAIAMLLRHATPPLLQSLAVEMAIRGFTLWQAHIDAVAIVHALVHLASASKDPALVEMRKAARQAILRIAQLNTALFVTTIVNDLKSSASDITSQNAAMQLIAFIVRREPEILLSSIPRLIEGIVKCLDPFSNTKRGNFLQSATLVLSDIVDAYAVVDFYPEGQRLAVGSAEGAVIVYDLKTATRLHVLENHRRAVAACSFSPDGYRLVSASLLEGKVVVWKMAYGLMGLFSFGTPSRQNSSTISEPYKSFDFNIPEPISPASKLEARQVATFEWPAPRTARLKIGQSTFTFAC
ncbi:hypothetical protein E5Q_03119 [Mixia osmundae IAM 14324]|uniref:Uncharacterized protein n=1 Tax=Mixia osmundae (strain CBS 9802 / IAM 14324 / JCM 22182 / KY 12970) TaxID=764103 RepID=G7E0U2_MIXOS|nr:hypothetical protein E5Q_03119 [Mixia osmundae IAM 14324]